MFLGRRHLFHIVNPSPWPLFVSISAFFFTSGLAFYMHAIPFGGYFLLFGVYSVCCCGILWLTDIVDEATFCGYHTLAVRMGLRSGFLLFIVSEIMLFFGFFWAFLHSALCPSILLGSQYPPVGINLIPVFDYPLYNTMLLIASGISITWAHRGVSVGSFKEAIDALILTMGLGFLFISLQSYEYYESAFNFSDSVYACSFYMLTGLHGFHVIVGVIFITVCFYRLLRRHFLTSHYLGFVFAIWYWHFVDVVWILLFFLVYCWGSW